MSASKETADGTNSVPVMEPFYSQRLLATPLKPEPAATVAIRQYPILPMEVMVTTEVTVTYEKRTYENEKPLLSSFVTAVKPSDAMDSKTIGEKNDAAKSKVAKKRKKFKNKKKGKVDGDKMEASGSGIDTAANGGKEDVHVGSSGLAGEVASQKIAGGDGMKAGGPGSGDDGDKEAALVGSMEACRIGSASKSAGEIA